MKSTAKAGRRLPTFYIGAARLSNAAFARRRRLTIA